MYVPEPVMSLSIRPTKKEHGMKFGKALSRFQREDPTFRVKTDEESEETIISGMGELHLEIYAERMRREYGIDVETGAPAVNYRETVNKRSDFWYLHKKQTGGAGQYAGVVGYIEPIPGLKPGEYVPSKFVDKTVGMNIGPEFKVAIEKGFLECTKKGPQLGYPVLNVQYVLTDGMTHTVDSNTNAFISATKGSFRQALPNAEPTILEPIMTIEVTIPQQFQTNVIGGLIKRRCMVKNSTAREDGSVVIEVEGPLAKMFGYASELRSGTQGQGEFSMEFSRLEPVNDGDAHDLRESYQEKLEREKGKDSFDD
jgi:elongation factor G